MDKALKKAIEEGYKYKTYTPFWQEKDKYYLWTDNNKNYEVVPKEKILLDPIFWKALSESMDLGNEFANETWHALIDHLASGGEINRFFEELL